MNKRRIMGLVLAVGISLGGSNSALASEKADNTVKASIVQTTETEANYLSDEEAVKLANEAMKEYLNIDTNCFSGTEVTTFDYRKNVEVTVDGQKYMVDRYWANIINDELGKGDIESAKDSVDYALKESAPSTIFVHYIDKDAKEGEYRDNEVTLNAETGEVIRISKHKEFEELKGEIDKNKVKEAVVNFLNKFNLTADEKTNWDNMILFPKEGEAILCLKVNGGMKVDVEVDLKDYSVMNFYKVSIMYPNENFETL